MRKLLPMVLFLMLGSVFISKSQDNSSRTIKSDLVDNRKLEIDESIINSTFVQLKSTAKAGQNLTPILFTDADIQEYLNLFEYDFLEVKDYSRKEAQTRVEGLVTDAKSKLEGFKNAKSVKKINSKSFYGDDSYLSKVLSINLEMIDQYDQFVQYEVVLIEINNSYKILAIN